MTRPLPKTLRWRQFWRRVAVGGPDGDCREWMGTRWPAGYGKLTFQGRLWLAHRLVWSVYVGPIPDGLLVRHDCDNPCCVNLAHLRLGTFDDNRFDRVARGRYEAPAYRGLSPEEARSGRPERWRGFHCW